MENLSINPDNHNPEQEKKGRVAQIIEKLDNSKFNTHPLTKKVVEVIMAPTRIMSEGWGSLMNKLESALGSGKDEEVTQTMTEIVEKSKQEKPE